MLITSVCWFLYKMEAPEAFHLLIYYDTISHVEFTFICAFVDESNTNKTVFRGI